MDARTAAPNRESKVIVMPLPDPAPRRLLHQRTVHCHGYQRDDGLWDVEGRITDAKPFPCRQLMGYTVPAGQPYHDISIRLTLDLDLTVVAVATSMDATPFDGCPAVLPAFQNLVGLRIGGGWRKAVKERVGGTAGCAHIVELLGPVATAVLQTVADGPDQDRLPFEELQRRRSSMPMGLDGCHMWRADGEIVRTFRPNDYRPAESRD